MSSKWDDSVYCKAHLYSAIILQATTDWHVYISVASYIMLHLKHWMAWGVVGLMASAWAHVDWSLPVMGWIGSFTFHNRPDVLHSCMPAVLVWWRWHLWRPSRRRLLPTHGLCAPWWGREFWQCLISPQPTLLGDVPICLRIR